MSNYHHTYVAAVAMSNSLDLHFPTIKNNQYEQTSKKKQGRSYNIFTECAKHDIPSRVLRTCLSTTQQVHIQTMQKKKKSFQQPKNLKISTPSTQKPPQTPCSKYTFIHIITTLPYDRQNEDIHRAIYSIPPLFLLHNPPHLPCT